MVISCVAYNCKNLQDKRFKRHFHSFPFCRPHVLSKWIAAVRRENWEPSRASRLCSDHFNETDYEERTTSSLKRLKPNAVPSIFKFPPHVCEQSNCRRKHVLHEPAECVMPVDCEAAECVMSIDCVPAECVMSADCKPAVMPDKSTFNVHKPALQQVIGSSTSNHFESATHHETDSSTFEDCIYEPELKFIKIIPHGRSYSVDAACSPIKSISNAESERITYLKRKIRTLQETARRRKKKIDSLSSIIQELKKTGNTTETLNSIKEENCQGLSLQFLKRQYQICARSPQKRKYTDFIKQFSQTLYFHSPKAYRYVSQHFVLPNPRTLRKWIN